VDEWNRFLPEPPTYDLFDVPPLIQAYRNLSQNMSPTTFEYDSMFGLHQAEDNTLNGVGEADLAMWQCEEVRTSDPILVGAIEPHVRTSARLAKTVD
jgi:hypothetical protein